MPINKKVLSLQTVFCAPPPTCLSSFQKDRQDRTKRETLKSWYLSQELFLSGAEAQSIMGEVPKCPTKLELIPCVAKRVCHM